MIDLSRTRAELIAEIGAPLRAADPLTDVGDVSLFESDAHLLLRGHTRQELFPVLEAVLTERFAAVTRARLHRDLLVPLRSAIGNAHKRGNRGDAGKWVEVDTVLTRNGALLAVRDEGDGFDFAQVLEQRHRDERAFENRGAGFSRFDRSASIVSWEDGGRTLLLRFLAEPSSATPSAPAMCAPDSDAAYRNAIDPQWMRARLAEELPELARSARLESLRATVVASDARGERTLRYVLSMGDETPARIRVLTGRLHADTRLAGADFEAATRLHRELDLKSVAIPRPLARLAREPRLVLHDVHPWMSFTEYLDDRGDQEILPSRSRRIARALRTLHRSRIAFREVEPDPLAARLPALHARLRDRLPGLEGVADLEDRLAGIVRRIEEESAPLEEPRPTHGGFGFDCVLYDVDGRFHLTRLETCRRSQRGLDLGGFLADLRWWARSRGDSETCSAASEAFLAEYNLEERRPVAPEAVRPYVALALLERLDREGSFTPSIVDASLRDCEDTW